MLIFWDGWSLAGVRSHTTFCSNFWTASPLSYGDVIYFLDCLVSSACNPCFTFSSYWSMLFLHLYCSSYSLHEVFSFLGKPGPWSTRLMSLTFSHFHFLVLPPLESMCNTIQNQTIGGAASYWYLSAM